MARADDHISSDVNDDTELAVDDKYAAAKLSSASFRSATSYASFRSCRSIKSYNSRSSFRSFKSAVSRNNSYNSYNFYNCQDDVMETRTGLVNEGYQDNVSFYSFNGSFNSPKNSIISTASGRLRSVSDSVLHSFVHENIDDTDSTDTTTQQKKEIGSSVTKTYLSFIFVIVAGVAVGASTYCHHLSTELPTWVVMMYRSLIQLLISLLSMLLTKSNPLGSPGTRWQLLVSGLLNSVLVLSLYLIMSSSQPMSTVVASIMMLTPVTTNIISSMMCREHIGIYRVLTLCVYVAGTLLVTRPGPMFPQTPDTQLQQELSHHNIYGFPSYFSHEDSVYQSDVVGVVAAVVVIIISGVILNLNRQCKETSLSVVLFWNSLGSVAISAIGLYTLNPTEDAVITTRAGREIPDLHYKVMEADNNVIMNGTDHVVSVNRMFEGTTEWLVASLISLLGVFATLVMIKVTQYIEPGTASLLHSSHLITGYILVTTTLVTSNMALLDLVGVILVILTVLAVLVENKIVDVKRWKWF